MTSVGRMIRPSVPAAVEQLAEIIRRGEIDESSAGYAELALLWLEDLALRILADIDCHMRRTGGRGL